MLHYISLKIERITYRNRSVFLFKSGFVLNLNRFDARSCIKIKIKIYSSNFSIKILRDFCYETLPTIVTLIWKYLQFVRIII